MLDGDTLIISGDDAIPVIVTGVVPSVYVRFHGCVPVRDTFRFVEPPVHIVAVPLITEVGLGFTVIIILLLVTLPQFPLPLVTTQ